MHILGMHHVAVFTRRFEAMEHFYADVLGLPVTRRWDDAGIVFFGAGSVEIELTRQDKPGAERPPPLDQGIGVNHIALGVADLDQALRDLHERGVHLVAGPAWYKSIRSAFFSDPDGNVLELVEQSIGRDPVPPVQPP